MAVKGESCRRNRRAPSDALHNLPTAIIVDQQPLGGHPRSTLGTAIPRSAALGGVGPRSRDERSKM